MNKDYYRRVLSASAYHAIRTADRFGCLMPSYLGSPAAEELRRAELSAPSTDLDFLGWEQLNADGMLMRLGMLAAKVPA
jgi:hypothetical protein